MIRLDVGTPSNTVLRPVPERAGDCPRCNVALRVRAIRLPGWRSLVDGECDRCGHRMLQDLPTGHGLVYPTTFDLTTGEIIDPAGASWFSAALRASWERPDADPVALTTRGATSARRAVLANCLDPVYGHAVLKLLATQRELDAEHSDAVVALVPAALASIIPEDVAEAWIVDGPLSRLWGWPLDLEDRLAAGMGRFEHCRLAALPPHPHPSTFDLERFVGHIPVERLGSPTVLLSLRADRRWGANARVEAANVAGLTHALRSAFPEVVVAAVGAAEPELSTPGVLDLRAARPDERAEQRWIGLMRGADLVVGVHGSNLVLPSGLANATIEIVPRDRHGNYLQATLVRERDPLLALDRHRTFFGNEDLGNVDGAIVGDVAVALLTGAARVKALMTGPVAGVDAERHEDVPCGPPRRPHESVAARPPRRSVRSLLARASTSLANRRGHYRGGLPAVVSNADGFRFELHTAAEVESLRRGLGPFNRARLELARRLAGAHPTVAVLRPDLGVEVVTLAHHSAHRGRIHAIEPGAEARERLRRTLELNNASGVVVSDCAIGESGASPSSTLDGYCDEHGLDGLDLLWIKSSQILPEVLRGAEALLARHLIGAVLATVEDPALRGAHSSALELIESFYALGLRPHVIESDGGLAPIRVAGPQRGPIDIVALSPTARERVA